MEPIPPLPPLENLATEAGELSGTPVVIAVFFCAILLVAARDWRAVLAAFMVLYLSATVLTLQLLQPQWALLRVIVGGLVAIMWFLSAQRAGWGGRFLPFRHQAGVHARPLSSTTAFRTLMALTLAAVLLVTRPNLPLPLVPPEVRLVVIWLAAFALLQLALGDEALQVGVALLMWLVGTQLLMSALQLDPWLIWLLSTVELLIGLAVAYLMVARGPAPGPSTQEESG
ncbi:MAG: hypothetical protein U9R25_03435 [Chloroflexota bacterium]|nr:hypothetical protein [Chloroflexota bacterium]